MNFTEENFNLKQLRERLKAINESLPLTFNYHDYKRLWLCQSEDDLKHEFSRICDEIHGVYKANLSINHSNFSL